MIQLWDTAGQEKYKSIAPIYYRQARIALCVYDICSKKSFEVMQSWVDELKANGPQDIILAVVGNKIDKYDDEEVSYQTANEYATKVGAVLKLVSAKEGKNIKVIFFSFRTFSKLLQRKLLVLKEVTTKEKRSILQLQLGRRRIKSAAEFNVFSFVLLFCPTS